MTGLGKNKIPEDTFLIGIGASPGIGIGETHSVNRERMRAVERPISTEEIPFEVNAFLEAVQVSKRQLEEVKDAVADRQLVEHLYIIDTHLLILEDQMLIESTLDLIRNQQVNAQGALKRTLRRFREVFDRIEDEYLRERGSDIDSIGDRLLRNLLG